jgi:hypothetical protein
VRDMIVEAKTKALYDFFVALHTETGLALREHNITDKFYVQLQAQPRSRRGDVHDDVVIAAAAKLEKARALFEVEDADLEFQVYVDRKTYTWNGTELTVNE